MNNKKNKFSKSDLIKSIFTNDLIHTNFLILYNKKNNIVYEITNEDVNNIIVNCTHNNITIFKKLIKLASDFDITFDDFKLIKYLIKEKNNDLLDYIFEKIDVNNDNYKLFFDVCNCDDYELIDFIYHKSDKKMNVNVYSNNNELIKNICTTNKVNTFTFLICNFKFIIEIDESFNDANEEEHIFFYLCRYNNIKFLKLYRNLKYFNIQHCNNEAICLAIQENHLELAKWIYSIGGNITVNNNWCLKLAINKTYINVIEWIISLNVINIHDNNEYFFRYACLSAPIETVKFLYDKYNVDIHAFCDEAFINSCISNRIDVVKWMYSIGTYDMSNGILFTYMIQYNNLELAKWIYSVSDIDIHANDEFIFRLACNLNFIDTAKWVYSLGNVDIKSYRNQAFKMVCSNNYLEFGIWLQELNPEEYKITIENNNITDWKIIETIKVYPAKKVDNINTCPICYDNKSNIITDCNHQYCFDCLKSYINKKCDSIKDIECPLCRKNNLIFFKLLKN
jgi:hypothetical protein